MNESGQKRKTWHPLGTKVETTQNCLAPKSVYVDVMLISKLRTWATAFVTFLTIDQSESCGFRRNARVINL